METGADRISPFFVMNLTTKRLVLRSSRVTDASILREYFIKNKEFLSPWEPLREDNYYSLESLEKMIKAEKVDEQRGRAVRLYIFRKGDPQRIIGFAGLTNIQYGFFLSCCLGYKLDQDYINCGYISEALKELIDLAFQKLGLHRIESNVMPSNYPSRRVMEKLGFSEEGISPEYLKINGKWEDHIHYVLLNKELE